MKCIAAPEEVTATIVLGEKGAVGTSTSSSSTPATPSTSTSTQAWLDPRHLLDVEYKQQKAGEEHLRCRREPLEWEFQASNEYENPKCSMKLEIPMRTIVGNHMVDNTLQAKATLSLSCNTRECS